MRKVRLAVVGLYFGTVPKSPAGEGGIAASKFRDAPVVEVPQGFSIKGLADAVHRWVAGGHVPGVSAFRVIPDSTGHFMKTVEVTYSQPPKPGKAAGTYAITDTTDDPAAGPLVTAWQTYFYDRNFRQKNTDGFQEGDDFGSPRLFEDGDLVVLRAVQILRGPSGPAGH